MGALTVNRTQGLQIFSLTLSQLSYRGLILSEHLSVECYNTRNTTIEAFWTYFLCFWACCRARIFPILVPSGARSYQRGKWAKCVIPGLPSLYPRATAPQPNPVLCSIQKSANDVHSSTGWPTRHERMPRPGIEPGTFRSSV